MITHKTIPDICVGCWFDSRRTRQNYPHLCNHLALTGEVRGCTKTDFVCEARLTESELTPEQKEKWSYDPTTDFMHPVPVSTSNLVAIPKRIYKSYCKEKL